MFRITFVITILLILVSSPSSFASTIRTMSASLPEPNTVKPTKTQIAPLTVRHFALGRSGYLTVVLHGNKVIYAQYIKQEDASLEIQKTTEAQLTTKTLPSAQVSLENDTVIIAQLTFADEAVVFVVIHIATGTTTVIANS
ncbi:MAG: hypothetical protein JKY46_05830 [Robiginitomaculum sp.]|nr:hypothetical protein [Robiginitomaculum sp.]